MEDNNGHYETLEEELAKELVNRSREGNAGDSNAITSNYKQRMSYLNTITTAIKDEENYRQAIMLADFQDDEEADRVTAAIEESDRYGLSLKPILDWVTARCAVNKQGHGKSRVVLGMEGLTHSTFTTQRVNEQTKRKSKFNVGERNE